MADIQTYLDQIKNAQYGKDVRQSIHDGIKQCYEDGKAGAIDLTAREDINALNSALEPKLTLLKSADENYFSVNGGHCTHIGNMYIFHIDISVMKQIQANYDTGNGKGPRVVRNLPFTWAYTFNFSATLNDHTTLILVGNAGENTLRLHTMNPLLPRGRKIIANFSFPDNYVS